MKLDIIFIIPLFTSCPILSQNLLTGKVIDASANNPLTGATVTLANSAVTTDKNGKFSIACSKSKELIISFVGYESFKYAVRNCNEDLSVALVPALSNLNSVEIITTLNGSRSLLYQPVSLAELSEIELKRGTGLFLDDAINSNVPGVTMQRRAVSSGQQFNIRGYGNGARGTRGVSSNFDGQGYKVYLNNIPLTDAEGITVFDDVDFSSVGTVEVVKGPAGTLFGLAAAGAVNLKTVQPVKGETSIGQFALFGNYGLQRYTTHFQTATERFSLLVNYGKQKSNGFMSHSVSHKDFVNLAAEIKPGEKQAFNIYLAYSNSYEERSGELTIAQYDSMNYIGNPNYIKNNAHSNVITFRAGVGHTYYFSRNISNTTTIFGTGSTNNASSAGGWTDKSSVNYGVRSTLDVRLPLSNALNFEGVAGIEAQRQDAQTIGYGMITNPADPSGYNIIGSTTSNVFTVNKTTSLFTSWTLTLPKEYSVKAGVGLSNMHIQLNDRIYAANKPTFFENAYTGMVSPHVAFNKVINKQFSVYVSYSKGFKAPVSSYFYIPYIPTAASGTGKVNTALQPEIATQFEVGTKGASINNRLMYDVALFSAKFSNKMTSVAVPLAGSPATTAYSYMVNGGQQKHRGVEASVKYTVFQSPSGFLRTIRPFTNMTYSNFKYDNFNFQKSATVTEDYSGKEVAGVPE